MSIQFQPTTTGTRTGSLTVSDTPAAAASRVATGRAAGSTAAPAQRHDLRAAAGVVTDGVSEPVAGSCGSSALELDAQS